MKKRELRRTIEALRYALQSVLVAPPSDRERITRAAAGWLVATDPVHLEGRTRRNGFDASGEQDPPYVKPEEWRMSTLREAIESADPNPKYSAEQEKAVRIWLTPLIDAADAVCAAWNDYAACEDYDAVEAAVERLRNALREQTP